VIEPRKWTDYEAVAAVEGFDGEDHDEETLISALATSDRHRPRVFAARLVRPSSRGADPRRAMSAEGGSMTVNSNNNVIVKKPVVITATKANPITPSWLRQPLDAPGWNFPLLISLALLLLFYAIVLYSPPPPNGSEAAQKKRMH
jgi:hypothetical protein